MKYWHKVKLKMNLIEQIYRYRGTVQPVIEKIAQMFKSGQIDVSLVR